MRIVLQRVSSASVRVDGSEVASIGPGVCLLAGIARGDGTPEVEAAAEKIAGLRVFPDSYGKMNLSLADVAGAVLLVSQFTLVGVVRKGRRPSFSGAAAPEVARGVLESLAEALRDRGVSVAQGVFGARMEVELVNDGPVTLVLEIEEGAVR
jgi:D-tyrosyl-tRNA(Tyr) deacylase